VSVGPTPVILPLEAPCGTGAVAAREFGVNGLERLDEPVCCDQKAELCSAEPSVRRLFGRGVEGVEWLPYRGR
jgi:hypothetical protein